MPTGTPPSRPPPPNETDSVPILPLRNSVLFPMSVVPINVGRPAQRPPRRGPARARARPGRRAQPALGRRRRADLQGALRDRHRRPRGQGHPPRAQQLLGGAQRPGPLPRQEHRLARALHARQDRARTGVAGARRRARRPGRRPPRVHARGARPDAQPPPRHRRHPRQRARAGRPGRSHRLQLPPGPGQRRRQGGDPRGVRRQDPRPPGARHGGPPARGAPREEGDLLDGAGGDGQVPARVHPPPADEVDQGGARRGRRRRRD